VLAANSHFDALGQADTVFREQIGEVVRNRLPIGFVMQKAIRCTVLMRSSITSL
jgi:hypothetical protein